MPKIADAAKAKEDFLSALAERDVVSSLGVTKQDALSDLYVFAKHVLGYQDIEDVPHRDLCDTVMDPRKRKLVLYPRGHFKSTIATISYMLWRIVRDPDIRILVTSAELRNSIKFLREAKGHIESNETFRALFGDLTNLEGKWTEDEIEVKTRRRPRKEPTVQIGSVGTSKVSQHYDLIIADDIVNRESVTTKDQIEKTELYYKDLLDLLEPTGDLLVIGTRWHWDDLYSRLIANADDRWLVDVKRAIDLEGNVLFPSRFNERVLADLKRDKGSFEFSAQYLNEPTSDENAVFRSEWFHYYADPPKGVLKFITVDPAISERQSADFSVILTCAVDSRNRRFVVEIVRRHMNPTALIDEILRLSLKHRPVAVGVETVAYQRSLKHFLMEKMIETGIMVPVVELKPDHGDSKDYRIRQLIPLYESGSVFHPNDGSAGDLEDEMLRYPRSAHDDVLDAMAYQVDIMRSAPRTQFDDSLGPNPLTHNVVGLMEAQSRIQRRRAERSLW